jgi:DNA-binding NtrC family response regulator
MKTILVIDDEPDMCALVKLMFAKENYRVTCAYCLADAEQKLLEHPQIVLLDNNLPDGSGLDFFQLNPVAFKETVVILISADANPMVPEQAERQGIRAFVHKPFSMGTIKEIIWQVA